MQRHSIDPAPFLQDIPSTPRGSASCPSSSMSQPLFASPISSASSSPYSGLKRRDTYPVGSSTSNYHNRLCHVTSFPHVVRDLDLENDRLARACGLLPPMGYSGRSSASRFRQQKSRSSSSPRFDDSESGSPQRKAYPSAPRIHYRRLLPVLDEVLHAQGLEMRAALNEEDVGYSWEKDMLLRERRSMGHTTLSTAPHGDKTAVFSTSLDECPVDAFSTTTIRGYRHDLPTIVSTCIEELYRTGIYRPGLFRDLPNRLRLVSLIETFNAPPSYGQSISVRTESTADICALLTTYLNSLPQPLIPPSLFTCFWQWCVLPSVRREETRDQYTASQWIMAWASRDEDEEFSKAEIAVAQILLHLLPTNQLSLFAYLCAFFTQVPLCPENGITFEDIGGLFGEALVGGEDRSQGKELLVWFLRRWRTISEGLLDGEESLFDGLENSLSALKRNGGGGVKVEAVDVDRVDAGSALAGSPMDCAEESTWRGSSVGQSETGDWSSSEEWTSVESGFSISSTDESSPGVDETHKDVSKWTGNGGVQIYSSPVEMKGSLGLPDLEGGLGVWGPG